MHPSDDRHASESVYLEKYVLINNKWLFTNRKQVCLNKKLEVLLLEFYKNILVNLQQLNLTKSSTKCYYLFKVY